LCAQYTHLTFPPEFYQLNVGLDHPGAGMSLAEKIKAATAYCLGNKRYRPADDPNAFPWSIGAFRALCEIKSNTIAAASLGQKIPRTIIEPVIPVNCLLIVRCMSLYRQTTPLRELRGRKCLLKFLCNGAEWILKRIIIFESLDL